MNEADKLKFAAQYRKYDPDGRLLQYRKGDVVVFNGINYIATNPVLGKSPVANNSGWEKITQAATFYCQSEEPQVTFEGDRWFNPDVGLLYTRVCDNDGLHWVAT
jgi:hypothetical protein